MSGAKALKGALARLEHAPSNSLSITSLRSLLASGKCRHWTWSNSTSSWPGGPPPQ